MTDKDLRKLSREDLLQLLLEQGREVQRASADTFIGSERERE